MNATQHMTHSEFEQHVRTCLGLVARPGGATFVDLERLLRARGVGVEGGMAFVASDRFPNAIAWAELSERAVAILLAVVNDPEVDLVATSPMLYLIQGRMLLLPVGEVRWLRQYRKPT